MQANFDRNKLPKISVKNADALVILVAMNSDYAMILNPLPSMIQFSLFASAESDAWYSSLGVVSQFPRQYSLSM